MKTRSVAAAVAAIALTLAASLLAARAETPLPFAPGDPPLHDLERAYLECDRLTATGYADVETHVRCVQVGEELLWRGFGGDFDGLISWWRAHRLPEAVASAEVPQP